jgi:Protein of unknown function (DUF3102)
MTTVPRTLVNVQRELSVALQHKTRDMLKIGSLLNEAKTFVEHGEWLPWLRRHTALTKRSAQNYIDVHCRRSEDGDSGGSRGSSRDRTPRWTTLMWRKTISPGPLPCTGSSQLAGLVQYPEPTE